MFYDFHQARYEATSVDRQHIPQHLRGRGLGGDEPCALLVRQMSTFKGGRDPKSADIDTPDETNPNRTSDLYLAPRELEVLKWAAQGKTAWETGQLLGLTEATVRFYIRRACDRLGVNSKTHAVAVCISAGVFKI